MAQNVTRSAMPGLIVRDPRFTYTGAYDSTNSSLTQAGPIPGTPEPQSATSMVLQASGTMAASTQMRVRCLKGGGLDSGGAQIGWRYQGDADYRGWNRPQIATGWECLDFTTTASKWLYPHAVRLADDSVLVVVQESGSVITVWKRSATANTWTEITVATHGTYTFGAFPTLVVMPSGRVLCYAWWEDSATAVTIRQYYSDDSGATWSLGSKSVLPGTLTVGGGVSPKRLRAATYNGQVLLVAGLTDTALTYDHYLKQYGSIDGGSSFSLVETWTGASTTTHAAYHDLVVVNGLFVLGYLASDATNSLPRLRRIANAYSAYSSATVLTGYDTVYSAYNWSTLTGAVIDYAAVGDGDYALALDEDGVLYSLGRNHSGGGGLRECVVIRSVDGGVTADAVGSSSATVGSGTWWNHQDATTYPAGWCAVFQAGRLLVPSVRVADGTTTDPSLDVVYLGGYSTVTMPPTAAAAIRQAGWERTWWGMTFPEAAASVWALTTGGAPTLSLTQGGARVVGAGGDAAVWRSTVVAPTSTLQEGIVATADVTVVAGEGYLTVRSCGAGPITFDLTATVTPTSIVLSSSAGTLTTVTTTAGATGVQLLLAVGQPSAASGSNGYGAAWYRATAGVVGSDQKWIAIGSAQTTLPDSATTTADEVKFGANASASTDVTFKLCHYGYGSYTGSSSDRLYRGQSNPSDLFGRALTASATYLDAGTRVRGIDGPAARGDVWHIDTDYAYPIRNIFPDVVASPQIGLRTTGETQTDIAWKADPINEVAPALGARALAIFEINWRTAELYGETAAGAWVLLASIDTASDAALAWERGGSVVTVDAGTSQTSATYYTEHSLARSTIRLDGTKTRKISTNRAGSWTSATTQRPRLYLSGADGTEATSGAAGELWHRSVVVVLATATTYRRYRLRITAQTTADGHFRIGTMLWGHLVPFAKRYARGRVQSTTPNVDLITQQSGTRSAVTLGRERRQVDVAWTDGTDTSSLWATTPTPDYVVGYTGSTAAIGAPAETPSTIHGLASNLASPGEVCVYLARFVPPGSAVITTITHPDQHLLVRMTTAPRTTTILGDEYDPSAHGEVVQLETVAMEEEV